LPAIIAVLIVYFWQGMGHFVMYMMQHRWFPGNDLLAAFIIGVIGVAMVWAGRDRAENAATLLGFAGGSLIWLSWVEFSFVWVARELHVEPAIWGAKPTLPEYRVMPSSVGVMFATLMFFFFNRETRCNAFMWLHRNLRMKVGEKASGRRAILPRSSPWRRSTSPGFSTSTCSSSTTRPSSAPDPWVTFASCIGFGVWAVYLVQRLWWYQRMAPALRYAIPTAIIAWNVNEILEKWGHLDEIWVKPSQYAL
jgi:hypothetical protein